METLRNLVGTLNGPIWGVGMLILIGASGIYFTIRLNFFQFLHFGDMWKRIIDRQDSDTGISTFASFCTTMAMRIGTGNVAGVAVALFSGGPGALFWMFLIGMTNSAVCFLECVQGSLFKTRIDGEYRGGPAYVAERALGWKPYGIFMAVVILLGTGFAMPAAATNTICDGFASATGLPMVVFAIILALVMFIVVLGGVKRIGTVASYVVPFMTLIYLACAIVIIIANITRVPAVIGEIISSAFALNAVFGGTIGVAIQQGIKRGTFSSASGMGESTPTAAAAETSHPVKQGMANAAGVWLDTCFVCMASGIMMMMTDCFNTATGYVGSGFGDAAVAASLSDLAAEGYSGVQFVQLAVTQVLGGIAPMFIAIMLALFSFTCIISYYYEAESAAVYLFQGDANESKRKTVTWILRIGMPIAIFFYGIIAADFAWDVADLALGTTTWVNMVIVWACSGPVFKMYQDYRRQMDAGKDPYYDPSVLTFKGVDEEMWKDINKKYIEGDD